MLVSSLGAAQQPLPITIDTSSLPRGYLRQAYSIQLKAENGTTPYTWQITSGALPRGLNLNGDGLLSGTPQQSGEFRFAVTASDSAKPAQQRSQDLDLQIMAPVLAKWGNIPKVNGRRIEGSVKVSNQTDDDFDFTVIVVGVNENGRATALGYQHFNLAKNTIDQEIPFGETLPTGSYQVNADVVGEVAAVNRIYRARVVTGDRLQVVQQP